MTKMAKLFPKEFNFFPQTFMLPGDYNEFRQKYGKENGKPKTFIVKPEANCQGRGIFVTQNIADVD